MQTRQSTSPVYLASFAAAFIILFAMQWFYYLNSDVSWLLTCTERLLHGGMYSTHFFETNPPLILFLYMPPLILTQLTGINITITAKVYFAVIAIACLVLCNSLLKKIFHDKVALRLGFLFLLLNCFLVLPAREYGQREHILMMFCMPYLLGMACRLQDYSLSKVQVITMGVLAAIGFALKPFYLLTFIGVELYYLLQKRKITSFLREENFVMAGLFAVYAIIVYLYFKDYLFVMIPFVSKYYYQGYNSQDRWDLLDSSMTAYIVSLSALAFFKLKNTPYRHLISILIISSITLYLLYILQLNPRYYKLVPVLACQILISALLFWQYLEEANQNKTGYLSIVITGVAAALFLYFDYNNLLNALNNLIHYFFIFYGALLFCFFYHIYKTKPDTVLNSLRNTLLILNAAIIFVLLTHNSFLGEYLRLAVTVTLVTVLFGFFIPNSVPSKNKYFATFILSTLILAYPTIWLGGMFAEMNLPDVQGGIVKYLRETTPVKSIYIVSGGNFTYPAINYNHIQSASRFPYFWMMTGLLRAEKKAPLEPGFLKDKKFFMNMITEDIGRNKPELIFIDVLDEYDEDKKFDYVKYFLQDMNFKSEFHHYHYYTELDGLPYFKFYIYKRRAD